MKLHRITAALLVACACLSTTACAQDGQGLLDRLTTATDQTKWDASLAKTAMDQLTAENATLKTANAQLTSNNTVLTENLAAVTQARDDAVATNIALTAQNADLKVQLAAVKPLPDGVAMVLTEPQYQQLVTGVERSEQASTLLYSVHTSPPAPIANRLVAPAQALFAAK